MPEWAHRYQALAELPFTGGYPTDQTACALEDELYFQRAVQTYLWALPAVNMYAMKEGIGRAAGRGYQVMSVFEKRLKPHTLITTPNCDVIYGLGFADLAETGPLVIEAPPGLQALLDDFWQRPLRSPLLDGIQYLGDIGLPGPDRGKGGRYLIVPEGYQSMAGEDLSDYYIYTSSTNGVLIFLRGFFPSVDDLAPGVAAVEGITVYPLHGQRQPMRFEHVSDLPLNALFPRGAAYFDLLDHAATVGWKTAKTIAARFHHEPGARWWNDRQWIAHVKTDLDDFLHTLLDEEFRDRRTGHTDVNAKAHMYVNHYSISTGMITSRVGAGAKYANTYTDRDGDVLMGQHTYRIDLPAQPPAKLLWSLTLYDADTAAEIAAENQTYSSLNSLGDLKPNEDGTYTIHTAPQRPAGAANWIRTVPARGWFGLIRWYSPEQTFFDHNYKPGDFVKTTHRPTS